MFPVLLQGRLSAGGHSFNFHNNSSRGCYCDPQHTDEGTGRVVK